MPATVRITPAELEGVRRIAAHDGGQSVEVSRNDYPGSVLEVAPEREILEQPLLFVGEDGTVYRIASEFEAAARRADVLGGNLLPMGEAELDPLPPNLADVLPPVPVGADLDTFGAEVVGVERLEGESDEDYRRRMVDHVRDGFEDVRRTWAEYASRHGAGG